MSIAVTDRFGPASASGPSSGPSSQPSSGLSLRRRDFLATAAAAAAASGVMAQEKAAESPPADFEGVVRLARRSAASPYQEPTQTLAAPFRDLSYDAYRAIRFRAERGLWVGEQRGFTADLLPPGSIYTQSVKIFVVEDGVSRPLDFDVSALTFGEAYFGAVAPDPQAMAGLAWTGFRLRYPLNRPESQDEIAVFQGATYFRAVARDQIYGLSARALAIRTGAPEGEEFPSFTQFWLHRPDPDASAVTVHALLDSRSVAGAYEFVVRPGAETTMDVRSVLFPRETLTEYGLAPLTSMYFFGPKDRRRASDFRDAVHDSEGLRMITGSGERVWRPLSNPAALQLSTFVDENPRGFGLVQRDRDFAHYQDAEARYDLRPSAWIKPSGEWGRGGVRLVEIPTPNEFNDNVVAFWRPDAPMEAGSERRIDYRLVWTGQVADSAPLARVVSTRIGAAVNAPDKLTVVVDFDLGERALDDLRPRAEASRGLIEGVTLSRLPTEMRVRAAMTVAPPGDGEIEFRLQLLAPDETPASETWLYRWSAA